MNPLDLDELKRQGYMMIDFLVEYYRNVANYPVLSQVQPVYLRKLLPSSAPSKPEPFETILKDVKDHIVAGITHWKSPNYFAYVPSSSSVAGFMGEMLSTGRDVKAPGSALSGSIGYHHLLRLSLKASSWIGLDKI